MASDERPEVATMRTDHEAYTNEVVVAGGLMSALFGQLRVEPVTTDAGVVTNELYIWPNFMKSRYRITVTLDPEVAAGTAPAAEPLAGTQAEGTPGAGDVR